MEKKIFTLKQVVSSIQKTLQDRYSSSYWIKAEINKLNLSYKGHCYPEIVQKQNEKIVAEMKGLIWSQQYEMIAKKFSEIVKEPIRDGIEVLFLAKIVFHPLYGLSLEIIDIDASFSLGEIEKEKRETLLKLKNLGILNNNQRLKFPLLPKRIAIISNSSGDGYKDFINKIAKNQWNYTFNYQLFETQLSGDIAVKSIIKTLEIIEKQQQNFDVVLIIRGGGSEIGMSCYNHYNLCEKICLFPLPILTGIGHASNTTVTEMVCYQSAITPSELAENLINRLRDFELELINIVQNISSKSKEWINIYKQSFVQQQYQMIQSVHSLVRQTNHSLTDQRYLLAKNSVNLIRLYDSNIEQAKKEIRTNFEFWKVNLNNQFNKIKETLPLYLERQLHNKQMNLNSIKEFVRLSDPIHLLKKGYSITFLNDKVLQSDSKIENGSVLKTISTHFEIKSQVIEVKKNKKSIL